MKRSNIAITGEAFAQALGYEKGCVVSGGSYDPFRNIWRFVITGDSEFIDDIPEAQEAPEVLPPNDFGFGR